MEHKNLEEEISSQLDEGYTTTDLGHMSDEEIDTPENCALLSYSKHHSGHGIRSNLREEGHGDGYKEWIKYQAHDKNGKAIGSETHTPEEAAEHLKNAGHVPPSAHHLKKIKQKAKDQYYDYRGWHFHESVEVTSNPIIEMVDSVIAGELTESTGIFEDLLAYKIAQKLEEKKIEVAQSIVEARYSSSKETFYRGFDDSHKLLKKKAEEKNDEVEEKENVNHPLRQLQNIKDQYENPISNEEKQTGNEAATKNALAKRLAGENKGNSQTKPKEGGSSGIEHFKHTNGKSTHLGYDEVKLLHHHLGESGALKPATKTAALSTIHSSPEGLAKVLGALRK